MRTTVRVDDALLAEARKAAAETGRSLGEVVEDALREALSRRDRGQSSKPVSLVTVGGYGMLPGVDLDDSAGLLDIMGAAGDSS